MIYVCRGCDKKWEFVGPPDGFYINVAGGHRGPYCDTCYDEAEWILQGKKFPPRKTFRRWLGDLIGGRS